MEILYLVIVERNKKSTGISDNFLIESGANEDLAKQDPSTFT